MIPDIVRYRLEIIYRIGAVSAIRLAGVVNAIRLAGVGNAIRLARVVSASRSIEFLFIWTAVTHSTDSVHSTGRHGKTPLPFEDKIALRTESLNFPLPGRPQ
jgi:hypothetical protein